MNHRTAKEVSNVGFIDGAAGRDTTAHCFPTARTTGAARQPRA